MINVFLITNPIEVDLNGDDGINAAVEQTVIEVELTGGRGARGIDAEGTPGLDGRTILNGTGAPDEGLGVNGDFYIDTASPSIYGPKTAGAWGEGLSLVGPAGAPGVASIKHKTVTAETYTVVEGDSGYILNFTGEANSVFSFTAAATLGDGFSFYIENNSDQTITVDPNGAELIDGLTSFIMYPGEVRLVQCTGTAFNSLVIRSFMFVATTLGAGSFSKPPGYNAFLCEAWGGGAGGASGSHRTNTGNGGGGGGGGGGGYCRRIVFNANFPDTVNYYVGAGGTGGASVLTGSGDTGTPGEGSYIDDICGAAGGSTGFAGSSQAARNGGVGGGVFVASGGAGGTGGANGAPGLYENQGSGGGSSSDQDIDTSKNGGRCVIAGGGGGGGGSRTGDVTYARGGEGGSSYGSEHGVFNVNYGGGGARSQGSPAGSSADGQDGQNRGDGGGGSGAAFINSGRGGHGAAPGGGGGGSGSTATQGIGDGPGVGGNGGRGEIRISGVI